MNPHRRVLLIAALAGLVSVGAQAADDGAAHYPDHPIRLIVGYPPGGGADIMARLLQKQLSLAFGRSVIVENRPGAGQNIADTYVARADPDGYTLLVASSALTVNPSLFPKVSENPLTAYAPIAMFAQSANLLVVNPKLPVNSVSELIAYEKNKPDGGNFSSSGNGSTQHLSGELFKIRTGVKSTHIPYKGSAPSVTAVISGEVDYSFVNIPTAKPLVLTHQLKALAVTSVQRSPLLPDVPTMTQAGVKDMNVAAWYGLLAPSGTPAPIVAKLNAAVNHAVGGDPLKSQLVNLGSDPTIESSAWFGQYLAEETRRWAETIKAAGIRPQ
ncbi:tripartite tricarboxylate transporter substrate binding protein [Paraburkholderia susongensis]|uniref:Tripartite-type tricarboxylate transporter, receptor component TctC n=1 Tax=Paraburkholderia susongensis TaxID=1515439 RepID=A0A1X7LIA4_9BURK|nr:tripartite tricarboxylate transporter substrate binding protein [Paraburkholderia susongensis]SMG53224.1 Tripartite-type tricarboxylate transporter, receptor component TctC [Paraburkholderia susongensis]